MSNKVNYEVKRLLEDNNARFRIIDHSAVGESSSVAKIRGTSEEQGAKAMLCELPSKKGEYILAILSGNRRVDLKKIGAYFGTGKARFVKKEIAENITDCVSGSIPPFSFSQFIKVIVDEDLINNNAEIAFNAGLLDQSIVLNTEDFVRISNSILFCFNL